MCMLDKDILINDLEMEFANAYAKCKDNDEDIFYAGVCSALQEVVTLINQQKEYFEWMAPDIIPMTTDCILLSFTNFPIPLVGRYKEGENGGDYYIYDIDGEDKNCMLQNMIVNGWIELPECLKN